MNSKLKKYIPNEFKESIYEVDFLVLYEKGYRLILIDVDNTLVNYNVKLPTDENITLVKKLQEIGFEVMLISNNNYKRVSEFAKPLGDISFVEKAKKPLKWGYKKVLKLASKKYMPNEVISVGDQIMTDVMGSNRMGFYSVLVRPIEQNTDVLSTRINRFFERNRLRKIKNKFPKIYEQTLKDYEKM